jgi:hypothetical protein
MTVQLSTHKMYKTIMIQLGVLWCGRRQIFKYSQKKGKSEN